MNNKSANLQTVPLVICARSAAETLLPPLTSLLSFRRLTFQSAPGPYRQVFQWLLASVLTSAQGWVNRGMVRLEILPLVHLNAQVALGMVRRVAADLLAALQAAMNCAGRSLSLATLAGNPVTQIAHANV